MSDFTCRIGTPQGDITTLTLNAVSLEELQRRLENEGNRIFSISPLSSSGDTTKERIDGSTGHNLPKISPTVLLLFTQQLASLIKAGIPILESIGMLRKNTTSSALRKVLLQVEDEIRSGFSLSNSLSSHEHIFPRGLVASIMAGEKSGALDQMLDRYVDYMRRRVELGRKLRGALTYPVILLIAATTIVIFLMSYVVPRMSELVIGVGAQLPTITVVVLGISSWLARNFVWLTVAVVGTAIMLVTWIRSESGRITLDRFMLRIPIVGRLMIHLAVAQSMQSMSTLLAGGITVIEAWDIASESIFNHWLRRKSKATINLILQGRTFSDSIVTAGWFPGLASEMIQVGEHAGALRLMVGEVANFYEQETKVAIEQLVSLLEPAILLVMGAIVAVILLSVYLPTIQAISSGSRL
ncbi:MAG: type II secretion system F family protein [Pyrinomonadaceae bacterium]